MSDSIPLGEPESDVLEFKGTGALERPETVARTVAAMLNGSGGDVWIGVEERGEIGRRVDPMSELSANRGRRVLEDTFVERIEPPPQANEVRIEPVAVSQDGYVLRVRVVAAEVDRRPFALLRKGGRVFAVRPGARNRPMTREEVAEAFKETESQSDAACAEALQGLAEARHELLTEDESWFWMRIEPVPYLDINVQADRLKELLQVPAASGNRRAGFIFTVPEEPWTTTEYGPGRRCVGRVQRTCVHATGSIDFRVQLARFDRERQRRLGPWPLCEFPCSVFRLARCVYSELDTGELKLAFVDYGLRGVDGWTLRPGHPSSIQYVTHEGSDYVECEDLLAPQPLQFTSEDLVRVPDRCAFRVVREIYQSFGFGEDSIPFWDDRLQVFDFGR